MEKAIEVSHTERKPERKNEDKKDCGLSTFIYRDLPLSTTHYSRKKIFSSFKIKAKTYFFYYTYLQTNKRRGGWAGGGVNVMS